MCEEILIMNDNAIAALVFLKETENPYDIFCRYISYCLDYNKVTTYEVLDERIKSQFGLNLPFSLCVRCMEILKSTGKVEIIRDSHIVKGYKLLSIDFDKDKLLEKINYAKKKELALINDMIAFVKLEYEQVWSVQVARKNLIGFFNYNDSAMHIFLNDGISLSEENVSDNVDEMAEDSNSVNDLKIVQQYFHYIQLQQNEFSAYFKDIVHGLMLINGISYSEHFNDNGSSGLQGVCFYFDTKLILRYLKFTTDIYYEAVMELVNLITNVYNGKLCIFRRTYDEVKNVLMSVHKQAKSDSIKDLEMAIFYYENKEARPYLLDEFKWCSNDEVLSKQLFEEGEFELVEDINWEDSTQWTNNLDYRELREFIHRLKPNWNLTSIDLDVDSFIQMNMIRNGDYSVTYGGKNHLPVFVTTNHALISCVRRYVRTKRREDDDTFGFNNTFSFISDRQLMCELWLPQFKNNNNASQILQSLMVDTILPFDNMAYNYIRDKIDKIKKTEKKHIHFNINRERQDKLSKLILKKDVNDIDNMDSEALIAFCGEAVTAEYVSKIASMEEDIAEKTSQIENMQNDVKSKEHEINDKITELAEKDAEIEELNNQIIKTHADRFLKQIGIKANMFVIIGNHWWWISAILLLIISGLIAQFNGFIKSIEIKNIAIIVGISVLPIVLNGGLAILNQLTSQEFVIKPIQRWCHRNAVKYYRKHICKQLPDSVRIYEEDIISYCNKNCEKINSIIK